jgi:hypothetical protein
MLLTLIFPIFGGRNGMTQNIQRLKAEIIAALDFLPLESLKLLTEFIGFLREKATLPSSTANAQQEPPNQLEDPILQFGTQPVVENVTDASIRHDAYLYG